MSSLIAVPNVLPARIRWLDGHPYSLDFEDIYFSLPEGLAESRAVFLARNDLPSRWQDWRDDFRIVELGFGTGLNFLATWQAYVQAGGEFPLHFISVEKHPLRADDLQRALAAWPELEAYASQLLVAYPELRPGWHYLSWGNVNLALYLGDVLEMLSALTTTVDTWYLDGFAPAKNQQMWAQAVLQRMAALSRPGTRFSTYSAAGAVRRGLQAAGFTVHKVTGFGAKRDMLCGTMD